MVIQIEKGQLIREEIEKNSSCISVEKGKISRIGTSLIGTPKTTALIDAEGLFIVPGFIDLHVHGGNGADVMDENSEAIPTLSRFHAKHGTTSLLLTTRAMPSQEITDALARIAHTINYHDDWTGAKPLGIHLEGPFLNKSFKGAQKADFICDPSLKLMKEWVAAAGGHMKLVTIAPEESGANSIIEYLVESGLIVSAGHSGATFEQMEDAIHLGVRHATHFFNGMRGFSHRDPGMLASIFMDPRVTAEVIMDTHHVHPAAFRLLLHNKGLDRVILITDAVRAAGLPDGEYESAGNRIVRVSDGKVQLSDGSLAGSMLTMNQAIANAVRYGGVTLPEAVRMASLNPASVLGLQDRKGSIEAGKDADLVIMDAEYNVQLTIVEGTIVYCSDEFRSNVRVS